MSKHSKKLIAPIVITALLAVYLFVFLIMLAFVPAPLMIKIIGVVVPLALIGASVYVLIERIKEIRSGEEDDLGKY
jgi:archaellum biogenesis protein FlaJ (TadC family)